MKGIRIKYFIFLLLPLPGSLLVGAQAPADSAGRLSLSLTQIWNMAESNSKPIKEKQLELESSVEAVKDAQAERLPKINVSGEYARYANMPMYENGPFHSPTQFRIIHDYYTLGTDAYFSLYNGNKVNLEIDARKVENKIAAEQKKLTVSEMKLRATAYYLDMQRSLIFRELLLQDIAAQETQLVHIQTLKKNGVVLKSDVLRAELKLSRQKLSLTELNNDLAIANQKLNIIIGLPDEQVITPDAFVEADASIIKPYTELLAGAQSNAYRIRISEQEKELSRLKMKSIKANVSPRVGLVAQYSYTYPQIIFFPYSANLFGLGFAGINASFPISSFYHNTHKSRAARLDYQRQEVEHAHTEELIRQQVNEAYLRYKEMLNRVAVNQTNVLQATENRRIVSNTYFNQLALITDLLDADTQLLQTRFDLAAAKIAASYQYYQLLNITGTL